jgi:alpha-D-ribose 1-methylphosphonate 5-triphosphate synthase subunit PhnG
MSRQDCDTPPPGPPQDRSARQNWLATLAKAGRGELEAAWAALPARPAYVFLRKPETGLTLLRGRIGGTGSAFNFGEASATRAAIRLEGRDIMGFGFVLGRDPRHAELAAAFDALLQTGHEAAATAIAALAAARTSRETARSHAIAASRVEFFTLARE